MAANVTLSGVRKYLTASARVKPEYEPHRHITSPYHAQFSMLMGGQIIGENEMGKSTVIKTVPGLLKKRRVNQLKVRILDNAVRPYKWTSAAGKSSVVDDTAFDLVVDSQGKGMSAGLILKCVETGATYRVQSQPSSNTVSLKNQSTATNIPAAATLIANGVAHEDFWTFGTGISSEPEEYSNLVQTMSEEYGIGIIAKQQELQPKGENGFDEDRLLALDAFNRYLELALVDGVKSGDGEAIQTMDGLRSLAEIVVDVGGTMSYESFLKTREKQVAKPGETYWMTGLSVKAIPTMWNQNAVLTNSKDKVYGSDVERIRGGVCQHVLMATEPMDNYPGEAVLFKPEKLEVICYGDLDTVHMEGVEAQNTAGMVNSYVGAYSLLRTDEDDLTRIVNWFN